MKAFLAGVAVMIVISVGAGFALNGVDFTSADELSSEHGSVRLGGG